MPKGLPYLPYTLQEVHPESTIVFVHWHESCCLAQLRQLNDMRSLLDQGALEEAPQTGQHNDSIERFAVAMSHNPCWQVAALPERAREAASALLRGRIDGIAEMWLAGRLSVKRYIPFSMPPNSMKSYASCSAQEVNASPNLWPPQNLNPCRSTYGIHGEGRAAGKAAGRGRRIAVEPNVIWIPCAPTLSFSLCLSVLSFSRHSHAALGGTGGDMPSFMLAMLQERPLPDEEPAEAVATAFDLTGRAVIRLLHGVCLPRNSLAASTSTIACGTVSSAVACLCSPTPTTCQLWDAGVSCVSLSV